MKTRTFLLGGLLAPILYVFTVILGGALRPGYSHLAQAISDLMAAGAPNKALMDTLFAGYNLLVLAGGWGVLHYVRAAPEPHRRQAGWVGALNLIAVAVFGLVTLLFPEDAGGLAAGAIGQTGRLHIVFAGLSSLTTMLAVLFLGLWFQANPRWRGLGLYSFASVLIVFVSGGFAAYSVANQYPLAGLVERITIGAFMQWLFVTAWQLRAAEALSPALLKPIVRPA
ncbi:MAG: DUF998 domain-containing protein [Anaerolineales bacterium]